MERDFEKELIGVKRDIGLLRDKVISAKAMMEQSEKQIAIHIENIAQLIMEDKREEFRLKAQSFTESLSSEESASQLFEWIENYLDSMRQENSKIIDELKQKIEQWQVTTS